MLIKLLVTSLGGLILAKLAYGAFKTYARARELQRLNPSLKIYTFYFPPYRILTILKVSNDEG
jgi:hypothetical protein